MDDQEPSSSGLMIGMIIGGAVVLVVLVLGGFGFTFLLRMGDEPVAPPPEAMLAIVEEQAPIAKAPEKPIDDGPPWPNPKRVEALKEKLRGIWATTFKDGRTETWELRADQTMDVTVQRPGKADEVRKVHWELQVELGGPGVSVVQVSDTFPRVSHSIRFEDDDHFVLVPTVTATVDGVPVNQPDATARFARKKVEKKP